MAVQEQQQQQQAQPPQQFEKSDMQKDVDHWVGRLNGAAANPQTITAAPGDAPWSSGFFDCFNPIDSCLMGWCCPCVLFGRTHHRLQKDANLTNWSPINASCLGWYVSTCCSLHVIGNMMQRVEIRTRSNPQLQGDFLTDCLKGWCCSCCDLIQQDKEAQALLSRTEFVTEAPPMKTEQMNYGQV